MSRGRMRRDNLAALRSKRKRSKRTYTVPASTAEKLTESVKQYLSDALTAETDADRPLESWEAAIRASFNLVQEAIDKGVDEKVGYRLLRETLKTRFADDNGKLDGRVAEAVRNTRTVMFLWSRGFTEKELYAAGPYRLQILSGLRSKRLVQPDENGKAFLAECGLSDKLDQPNIRKMLGLKSKALRLAFNAFRPSRSVDGASKSRVLSAIETLAYVTDRLSTADDREAFTTAVGSEVVRELVGACLDIIGSHNGLTDDEELEQFAETVAELTTEAAKA